MRGGCFAGESLVLTNFDGSCQRIDEIKVGTRIVSRNSEGIYEEDEVVNVHSTLVGEILIISLDNGV